MANRNDTAVVLREEQLRALIYKVRGVEVMLDRHLTDLYQIETRALKQAVKRNRRRFPEDFLFVLEESEIDMLVSQSVIPSKKVFGGAMPFAITEQGVVMIRAWLETEEEQQTTGQKGG